MYSKEQKVNFSGVGGMDLFLSKVTEKSRRGMRSFGKTNRMKERTKWGQLSERYWAKLNT